MNKRDYEIYLNYKDRDLELWNKHMDNYRRDIEKLNSTYKGYIDTIKEVSNIVKHRKTLIELLMEVMLISVMLLISYVPIGMYNAGTTSQEFGICIAVSGGTAFVSLFMGAILLPKDIKAYIKYKKLMRE